MRLRSAYVLTFAVASAACERGREPARPDPATPAPSAETGTPIEVTDSGVATTPPTSSASVVAKRPRRLSKGDTQYVRKPDGTCTAANWTPCPPSPPGKPTMPCNPPPVVAVKCPPELEGEESEFAP